MSKKPPSNRRVDPHDLNWLGKTVYFGGAALRLTAKLVDATADHVSSIASESKKAFDQGVNPRIEDARIVDESPHSEREIDENPK